MSSKNENPPFLVSLRSNYESTQKESKVFCLQVANLLAGLKIAEESGMDTTEIKSIRTGVREFLEQLPGDVCGRIDRLTKDPELKPQVNKLKGKKDVPSWLSGCAD